MTEDQALDRIRNIVYGQPIGSKLPNSWFSHLQRLHVRAVEQVRDREHEVRRDTIRRAGFDPDGDIGSKVLARFPEEALLDGDADAVRGWVWDELNVASLTGVAE